MAKSNYDAKDIEVLEGLEPVRERPGMYIAGTDTPAGLHQLVFEILDNSVDEVMNGHADRIEVTLHKGRDSVTISDNGRGIPVEKHPKFKKSALELILTTLHAGGKFSAKNYQTAGGLHGVGSSVVNALSEQLVATVKRGGKEYEQKFVRGKPKSTVKAIKKSVRGTGTKIFFKPDSEIFSNVFFSAKRIRRMLQTKAYLNPGLRIVFLDEDANTQEEFLFEEGLLAYLKQFLEENKYKIIGETFFIERINGAKVSLALAWTEATKEEFMSYANGIYTPDGGSHEMGAKTGVVRAVRNYLVVHNLQPKGVKVSAEDIREGVVCLTSVNLPNELFKAQFQGQTKSKLNNPEVAPIVESAAKALEQQFNENPSLAQAVINRVILAAKARAASRAAAKNVTRKLGVKHRLTLPGKLADCSSIRQDQTELLIVEGDSAGGSAKQGRDRHYQAVLPLRGKILNTISASKTKVADNKELSNIIAALGCGLGDRFQHSKLRYGKVIILTDADADGMHICTLLLAFFFSRMPQLIEQGALYIGKPPLYGIFPKGARKQVKPKGKRKTKKADANGVHWAYSEEELESIIAEHKLTSPKLIRYKGLGEMNPETLWETTLDPDTRTLLRVTMDDVEIVSVGLRALMGTDTSTRTQLIQTYAEQLEVDV